MPMTITRMLVLFWIGLGLGVFGTVSAQAPPPEAVAVVSIVEREVASGQMFIGGVYPSRKSIVGSAVDGRMIDVMVEEGDRVQMVMEGDPPQERGQPIAQLLTKTISIEIASAKAVAALKEFALAELEAGSRPEEIEQARAAFEAARAIKEYRESRFRRTKLLYEQGKTTSLEDFEEALSSSLSAEQSWLSAKAAHELAVQGPRKERIDQARAEFEAAREQVKLLEDRLSKYTIRAPFNGYIVAKRTEVGAWLSQGDAVVEVVQLDPIDVRVAVPEAYISQVHPGSEARIRLDSSPAAVIVGEVWRIVPQADERSRTFPVVVRLTNPLERGEHLLKAGMLARVILGVGQQQLALMVPKDALVLNGPLSSVVIAEGGSANLPTTARVVTVELGIAEDDLIQIIDRTGTLKSGQMVVVRGNERLRTGQPIQVVPSFSEPLPAEGTRR